MSAAVVITESVDIDALLGRIEAELRRNALRKSLRAAAKVVIKEAKAKCPVGQGRVGAKSGKKHLRDTITSVYREYGDKRLEVVGPAYPAGAHGHLVEFGHEEVLFGKPTGRRVPPHPFLRPAADATMSEQRDAIESTLREEIAKLEASAPQGATL